MDFCSGRLSNVIYIKILVKKGADVMCRCSISSEIPAALGYVMTNLNSYSSQLCARYNATHTNCVDAISRRNVPVRVTPSGSTEIYLKTKTSLPSGVLIVHGFGESITHLAKLIEPMTAREDGTLVNDFC